ncbi:MAG: uridine kinase [Caulobacterales bacterium]|nr:uridine kinase [Caulobacterales bacterium]MCA0371538.1 uridine kinase [Pseudomonadota bacterium]
MSNKPFLIGITGGSGSGKTTIARTLFEILSPDCTNISEDDYYKDTSKMEGFGQANFDYDNPIIRDHEILYDDLLLFSQGKEINQPLYDFVNHCRFEHTKKINPTRFLVIEGTHVLHNAQIRELLDLKIYIHTDEETRFKRRLERDVKERGRSVESVHTQYNLIVKPGHYKWTEPTKEFADLILYCNDDPKVCEDIRLKQNVDLIVAHIKKQTE